MKKLMMIGLVVAMVGATSMAAFSWGPGSMGGGYGGYGPGSCWIDYDRRSLTEDQEAKLEALERKHYDETRQVRRELWTKKDKLDELMDSANPDRNQIMSLQKEISQLRDQMMEKNLDYALEAKKIVPDSEYTGRGGRGPGMRGGYGMGGQGGGPGSGRGPGYCWR